MATDTQFRYIRWLRTSPSPEPVHSPFPVLTRYLAPTEGMSWLGASTNNDATVVNTWAWRSDLLAIESRKWIAPTLEGI